MARTHAYSRRHLLQSIDNHVLAQVLSASLPKPDGPLSKVVPSSSCHQRGETSIRQAKTPGHHMIQVRNVCEFHSRGEGADQKTGSGVRCDSNSLPLLQSVYPLIAKGKYCANMENEVPARSGSKKS